MSFAINPISVPAPTSAPAMPDLTGTISATASPSQDGSFRNMFNSAVQNVEAANSAANAATQNYLSGGTQELHSTILATQNAELNFEMFLQVRNKVVSAYEEIMKMQV